MPNIGIAIPSNVPDVRPETTLEFARRAEQAGADSVWTLDRITFDSQESLVMLGAVAAVTTRVKIGASVLLAALRPPALLAKMVASVDQISGGRLILGVGAGSRPDDFAAIEVPFEHRGSRLDETLAIAKMAWSGAPVKFNGRFFKLDVGPVGPAPIQKPHPPIWMGGFADSALRRVARSADGYVGHGSVEGFLQCMAKVRQFAEAYGRDPNEIEPVMVVTGCVDDDKDRASALAMAHFGRYWGSGSPHIPGGTLIGPADECLRQAETYINAGVKTLIFTSVTADLGYCDRLLNDVVAKLAER